VFPFQQGKQQSDSAVKKPMKEEKIRKKDDKSVEQVLKALNSLETTEEKLAAMCKKYTDIVDENRKLQVTSDVNVHLKFFCKKLECALQYIEGGICIFTLTECQKEVRLCHF